MLLRNCNLRRKFRLRVYRKLYVTSRLGHGDWINEQCIKIRQRAGKRERERNQSMSIMKAVVNQMGPVDGNDHSDVTHLNLIQYMHSDERDGSAEPLHVSRLQSRI